MPNSNVLHGPRAAARATDPITSHLAAETVDVNQHQRLVLIACKTLVANGIGEFTARDVERTVHPSVSPSSARTRLNELLQLGLVELTGETTTKYGNRAARTYRLPEMSEVHHAR